MKTIDDVKMPRRSTVRSAGYDLFAPHEIIVYPGIWTTVDTGVYFDGTEDCGFDNWVFKIYPKSGLSTKHGMKIKNTVPIIDADYRDTIKVSISSEAMFTIEKDEKYVQGIFQPFGVLMDEIPPTEERKGGHGSTGRF